MKNLFVMVLLVFIGGVALGYFLCFYEVGGFSVRFQGEYVNALDINGDGVKDVFYEYDKNGYYELVDRNLDGNIDESVRYNSDDKIDSSRLDDNYDGILETSVFFINGIVSLVKVDVDANGIDDLVFFYENGALVAAKKYYVHGVLGEDAYVGSFSFYFGYPVGVEEIKKTEFSESEFVEKVIEFHHN